MRLLECAAGDDRASLEEYIRTNDLVVLGSRHNDLSHLSWPRAYRPHRPCKRNVNAGIITDCFETPHVVAIGPWRRRRVTLPCGQSPLIAYCSPGGVSFAGIAFPL